MFMHGISRGMTAGRLPSLKPVGKGKGGAEEPAAKQDGSDEGLEAQAQGASAADEKGAPASSDELGN